jgi:uncharacterized protein YegL
MDELVRERTEAAEGQIAMPFYLVCDVSYSMKHDMAQLNDSLQGLHRAIGSQPVVDDVARICIMTFSDSSRVVMPLGQVSEQRVPQLHEEGGTYYGPAFRKLAETIAADREALKGEKYRIFRPAAFFLTDGEPLDSDWHRTFTETLTYDRKTGRGNKSHPVFVPFGFRDAPGRVIKQLAYPPDKGKWYLAGSTSPQDTLRGILQLIMVTIITSGNSVPGGNPSLQTQDPKPDSGIQQGESEYQDDWLD